MEVEDGLIEGADQVVKATDVAWLEVTVPGENMLLGKVYKSSVGGAALIT